MITSVKKLLGENDQNLGKWVKVSSDEEEAISESLADVNYARGAQSKASLRMYSKDGYVVICTSTVSAETHPSGQN